MAGESGAQGDKTGPSSQPAQEQSAPTPAPVVGKPVSDTGYYKADCKRPKEREDADLCEQIRQAQAAEDAVRWARFQSYLAVGGFGAVVLSLVFTGWAAVAAGRAAVAAEKAISAEEEREAPFLYPAMETHSFRSKSFGVDMQDHPSSPKPAPMKGYAQFRLTNYGRSAGIVQSVETQLIHLPQMTPELPVLPEADLMPSPIIEPGQAGKLYTAYLLIPLELEGAKSIMGSQSQMFLIGRVSFGSVSGTGYKQTFCLAFDPKSRNFRAWGSVHNKRSRKSPEKGKTQQPWRPGRRTLPMEHDKQPPFA